MATLTISFPARRYHATPWGHHVNEGLIEWPPSPWRLLRALLAAGYSTCHWNGNRPPPLAQSLIEKLASVLPTYRLPCAVGTHSRHYMPLGRLKGGQEDRTLVFDTWGQVNEGCLAVTWNVHLDDEELSLLGVLAERLGYLGRSESWVDAKLCADEGPVCVGSECFPSDAAPPKGWEQVSLLAPLSRDAYASWRETVLESALQGLTAQESSKKRPSKRLMTQKKKAMEPYPEDLIACLQVSTSWLHKKGWSQPPGSRKILYCRRSDSLEVGAPPLRHRNMRLPEVEFMLLSMTTQSNNEHALPSVTRTLPQGEIIHRALTEHIVRRGEVCPVLTGCDETRRPLCGPHEHAHVLPLDLNRDGHIDHILLWASGGLDAEAQQVVRGIRQTYTKGGIEPLRLALVGSGRLQDLMALPAEYGRSLREILGAPAGASEWRSLTPFIAPRYLKKSGKNTLEGQIAAELASRRLPQPADIRIFNPGTYPEFLQHRHFVRKRRKGAPPPADFGYSIQLRFNSPVKGPLCLGYASHFGMGLFCAVS